MKSVKSKTHEYTRNQLLEALEYFGLKESFMIGDISISLDGALFNMMSSQSEFFGIETRCCVHVMR